MGNKFLYFYITTKRHTAPLPHFTNHFSTPPSIFPRMITFYGKPLDQIIYIKINKTCAALRPHELYGRPFRDAKDYVRPLAALDSFRYDLTPFIIHAYFMSGNKWSIHTILDSWKSNKILRHVIDQQHVYRWRPQQFIVTEYLLLPAIYLYTLWPNHKVSDMAIIHSR